MYVCIYIQAFVHRPTSCAIGGMIIGFLLSFMRNDFGNLFRALGLMLIYLIERNSRGTSTQMSVVSCLMTHLTTNDYIMSTYNNIAAGTQYSALRQLRPFLQLAPRRPFPPVENPWAYVRASEADIEFSMTK